MNKNLIKVMKITETHNTTTYTNKIANKKTT